MADETRKVTLQIATEGADQAKDAFSSLDAFVEKLTKRLEGARKEHDQNKEAIGGVRGAVGGFAGSLEGLHAQLASGQQATQGFGGAMGLLSTAMSAATTPVGILVIGIGALTAGLALFANAGMAAFESLRSLAAISGLTIEGTENLRNAFQLAGVEGDRLNMALFRLGNEIETGGKHIRKLGIDIHDAAGGMKTEGDLLLEIRDKISSIGDAATRNAVLMQVFGRAGRAMAEAFSRSTEDFKKFIAMSEQNAALTDEQAKSMREFAIAQADLAQKWDKIKIAIASAIAIPIVKTITEWVSHLIAFGQVIGRELPKALEAFHESLVGRLVTGIGQFVGLLIQVEKILLGWTGGVVGKVLGWLTGIDFSKISAAWEKTKEAPKAEVARTITRGGGPITEGEAKQQEERVKLEHDALEKSLRLNEAYALEEAKIHTGSDTSALASKIGTNERIIASEKEKFDQLVAIAKSSSAEGIILPEEELKLRTQMNEKVEALAVENKKIQLQIELSRLADMKKVFELEFTTRKAASDQFVSIVEQQSKREREMLAFSGENRVQQAIRTQQIEVETARKAGSEKIRLLDVEIAQQRRLAGSTVASERQAAELKLIQLGAQRLKAEQEIDNATFQSRKELTDKLIALGKEEADAGASLEDKAISALEKRGKRFITQMDILQEEARQRQRGMEVAGSFGSGGRVSAEALRESRGLAGIYGRLGQAGGTAGSAAQMLQARTAAGFRGEEFMGQATAGAGAPTLPTGGGPDQMQDIRQGFADTAAKVKQALDEAKVAFGDSVKDVGQAFSDILREIGPRLVRELEFQASRG